MDLALLIQHTDTLKAEIDALRPIDAEQEARVMQMLRIDWNYHSNALVGEALLRSLALYLKAARHEGLEEPGAFEQQVLRLREQLASYDA
jgi:hypothetical protein